MEESWLPVVGFEGSYEVSDLGKVRSLDRILNFRCYVPRYKVTRATAQTPERPRYARDQSCGRTPGSPQRETPARPAGGDHG